VDKRAQLRTFLIGPYLVSFGLCRNATTFFRHPIRHYVKFSLLKKLTFVTPSNGNKFRKKKRKIQTSTQLTNNKYSARNVCNFC